jgi:hypothetical protein
LDWIATVPPTLRLTNEAFGDVAAPMVFGWIVAGHQIGAATAAMVAGQLRTVQGNYIQAFSVAGASGVLAALLALRIRPKTRQLTAAAPAKRLWAAVRGRRAAPGALCHVVSYSVLA